jgi:hypothetical protein
MRAFNSKLWWNFRRQTSLWAQFMKAKFCKKAHPVMAKCTIFSPTWKRMLKGKNDVEHNIRWLLGEGDISIFHDNWCDINISKSGIRRT